MSQYQRPYQHTKEINLKEYVEVIKKRCWIIVLLAVLTTAAGAYYSYYISQTNPPLYQTSTRMILGSGTEDMKTLMVMIKDPIIMESVGEAVGLSRTTETIAGQIEVNRIDDSQVIQISVIDQDPETAAAIANATAHSFQREIKTLLDYTDVQLLSEAKVVPFPINENSGNQLSYIAFAIGLVLGTGLAFLLDSLDDTVRKERALEEVLGVPVLGSVGNMNKKKLTVNNKTTIAKKERGAKVAIKENVYHQQ